MLVKELKKGQLYTIPEGYYILALNTSINYLPGRPKKNKPRPKKARIASIRQVGSRAWFKQSAVERNMRSHGNKPVLIYLNKTQDEGYFNQTKSHRWFTCNGDVFTINSYDIKYLTKL